ncbi:hypothetical protein ACOMHN_023296 [Nucella lapillus]
MRVQIPSEEREAGIMLPKSAPAKHIHHKLSSHIPCFSDVFDEESFYIFAVLLAIVAIAVAFLSSRYVKIKDAGHID